MALDCKFYVLRILKSQKSQKSLTRLTGLATLPAYSVRVQPSSNASIQNNSSLNEDHELDKKQGKVPTNSYRTEQARKNLEFINEIIKNANLRQDRVSVSSFREAIGVLGVNGKVKEAVDLFNHFDKIFKHMPMFAHNSVIRACAKVGHWAGAMSHLSLMESRSIKPTVTTYSYVFSSFIKNGPMKLAFTLLDRMKNSELSPDQPIYSILISICSRRGDLSMVKLVMQNMHKSGIVPNLICYNTALHACSRASNWQYALEILADMEKNDVQSDIITWNCLLDALGKGRQLNLVIKTFEEIKKLSQKGGLKLNCFTYCSLISAVANYGELKQVEMFFDDMLQNKIEPNIFIYSTLINSYANSKELEKAEVTFEEMIRKYIRPNTIVYNSVLKACSEQGDIQRTLKWFRRMQKDNVQRDLFTWNTIIGCAHKANDLGTADQLYSEALACDEINPYSKSNRNYGCSVIVDLHGICTAVALTIVRYELCKASTLDYDYKLGIITGRGRNGTNPVIKLAILKFLKDKGVLFSFAEKSQGMIVVDTAGLIK